MGSLIRSFINFRSSIESAKGCLKTYAFVLRISHKDDENKCKH